VELPECEPHAGPWSSRSLTELAALLIDLAASRSARRPLVVAVDGRSSSGKTSLCRRLCALNDDWTTLHTDDLAWWHSRFGWTDLLSQALDLVDEGGAVNFVPPAWRERGRAGAIKIPAGSQMLLIEGVGSSRREHAPLVHAAVWVQADLRDGKRRNAERVASGETTEEGVRGWMAEEYPFLEADRPWERADLIVAGTPVMPSDPDTHVVLSPRGRTGRAHAHIANDFE
jgi:hypothetical protein